MINFKVQSREIDKRKFGVWILPPSKKKKKQSLD